MGSCCSSTKQSAGEAVDQRIQEHKEEQIAKRVKKLGTLDEEALNLKAKLRSLDGAVDRLSAMHRTMSGVKNDTLHLPSLHIWSQRSPCIGGPTAPKALHDTAAHVNELSSLLVELRSLVFKQYAQDLLDCKAPMRAGIDAINHYIEAEEALSQKMAKLEKAGHPPAPAPAPAPAEGEAPAEDAPSSADTAAADKVAKLQADVDAAVKDAADAKENAMRVASEAHTKVGAEQLKSATEKMMEGRTKYVNVVAKLLSEPSTERIFDNYHPTSNLSGISDGITVASKAFDFKVDLFHKDSTEHSAEVTAFMETIKQADLEAELAKKQVVNFTKHLPTIFTSDQLQEAFTQLAENVEDEATKTLIAEVPPGPGRQEEFVSAANTACTDFQLCIENFRSVLLARINEAKAYHETGKRLSTAKANIAKKEKANDPKKAITNAERVECETLERSAEHMFAELKGHMDELADPSGLKPNSFIRTFIGPMLAFDIALMDYWKILVSPEEVRHIKFHYPSMPEPVAMPAASMMPDMQVAAAAAIPVPAPGAPATAPAT